MSASRATRTETAVRRAWAVRLRVEGRTWQDIADALGYASRGAAQTDVSRALAAALKDERLATDELREVELARLEEAHRVAWEVMHARHLAHSGGKVVRDLDAEGVEVSLTDSAPVLAAADRVRKISESRRRLLGLDAAVKIETEVSVVRYEINGVDAGDLR